MKPTIYDVAKEAQVSIATVSKVINDTGRISEKTRKRVLEAMEKLRYQPSVVASALTGKRTNTLGLLIPDLANPFFAEVARHVEDRGQEKGFNVIMCSTDYNPAKEAKYISLLKQKQVDGIILGSGFYNDQMIAELQQENFPLVMISQEIPALDIDTVSVDDFMGGYQVTQYLLSLGHRRIGVIAESFQDNPANVRWSSKERIRGYREALEAAGIGFDEDLVFISNSTIEAGKRVAGALLDAGPHPTAIFALNDVLAIGTIKAVRERGLKIPEDIAIVGFDDTILATIVDPPLTTVAQPIRDMGYQAMDLLIEKIEGKENTTKRIILSPQLMIRQTTCPLT
ncbi:transcriptional regulator, LacI family [Caldalkalibacillus thermarum TA2.A1]|uniref:LacI family transcriptional regulator n=1 Tax=Caldalkalibacillus thermarum (strain TA2.A1) TaxID=986075 RepID=F5L5R7_CALTT|nr:LacI family DNA-binding transcriptional regulator [Caldalkalibacillus thermarum]EGL83309.1 transcriptional regulator, LacI family [Caldalkalibacillus thermarum TA2.A1]QZT34096.1 LacI family transcriptional regulator [Caldalkalibacillus thermarum TA2.A1]